MMARQRDRFVRVASLSSAMTHELQRTLEEATYVTGCLGGAGGPVPSIPVTGSSLSWSAVSWAVAARTVPLETILQVEKRVKTSEVELLESQLGEERLEGGERVGGGEIGRAKTVERVGERGTEAHEARCEIAHALLMSLFGDDSDSSHEPDEVQIATTACPPIPGLFLFSAAVPVQLQSDLALALSTLFNSSNQCMRFGTLPSFLDPLLELLPTILELDLPSPLFRLLFHSSAIPQAIFNLYRPGQGITPHIDLPSRFADGIISISVCSSAVMDFSRKGVKYAVLLRPGDVLVMTGEARWEWTHGIAERIEDLFYDDVGGQVQRLRRAMRMSITLRRMKEGADVVGGESNRPE